MKPEILICLESSLILLCSVGYLWAVHHFCIKYFSCVNKRRLFFLALLAVVPSIAAGESLVGLLYNPAVAVSRLSLSDWILLCYTSQPPLRTWLPLFRQCLLFVAVLSVYQGKKPQKILAAAILLTTITLVPHFVEAFLECLILLILHISQTEYTLLLSYILGYPVCLCSLACTIGAIVLLHKRMTGFFADRLPKWYLMLSVPLFGIVILWDFLDLCAGHGILLRGGDHLNLYYNRLFSHGGICALSALCICAVCFYLFGMERIDLEQRQKERYRSQVLFYQMLETQYNSLENLRHDMKNHIIGLQRLIDHQEWDKMTDYLHKMADFGGINCTEDMTGKNVIDALLYYKKKSSNLDYEIMSISAKNSSQTRNIRKNNLGKNAAHVRWECDVQIPPDCPIDDFDLCVIFGNLLDNAVEACQKIAVEQDRFITVHACPVKKYLLIEITNSMPPLGSRKGGIGLCNVRETVEKYNGTLQITAQDAVFRISVLLPALAGGN